MQTEGIATAHTSPSAILVLRPDNIGDLVLFSGALEPIRQAFPEARIDLMLAGRVGRELFEYSPHVDRLLSIDRLFPWRQFQQSPRRGAWRISEFLQRPAVQRAIVPRLSPKYGLVIYPVSAPAGPLIRAVSLLRAPEKWGFSGPSLNMTAEERADRQINPNAVFTRTFANTSENQWDHELPRTRSFLESMGVTVPAPIWPHFWVNGDEVIFAREQMPADGMTLGVFLGAAALCRRWPLEKWEALLLKQRVAERIVLFGGPDVADLGVFLQARLGTRAVNLCGQTSIRQLVCCISRCNFMVGNESAGIHLSVALGIPTVGIIPLGHYGRFYPWAGVPHALAVHRECAYTRCNHVCTYGDFRCFQEISPEPVLATLEEAAMMGRQPCGLHVLSVV